MSDIDPIAQNAAEPIEPTAVVQSNDDLNGMTDEQITAAVEDAITEATAIVDAAANDPAAFDQPRYEAAMSRHLAAKNERDNRAARAAALAAARTATSRPAAAPVSVATISKNAQPAVPSANPVSFSFIVPSDAAGLIEGVHQGAKLDSFSAIGQLMDARASMVGTHVASRTAPMGLMQIRRHDTEFAVSDADVLGSFHAINKAVDQKRLTSGNLLDSWWDDAKRKAGGNERRMSLTAAAGWCAPSTTMYDLCEMETTSGVVDLPEVTATRGGIRWTQNPTFADLMAANMFTSLTEAQVIAATAKNCDPVPCPSFTDTRLNVAVTCMKGSFLQLRGYPELMARWGRGALVAHAHKLNKAVIAAMVTRAGAATVFANPTNDAATSSILAATSLAATDIRYREGLAQDAIIEVLLPQWALEQIRADWSRRNTGGPDVNDAQIMSWFMDRNIRPQFVRDWQDFWDTGAATAVGAPAVAGAYITALPTTVDFLAYPAGAVVLARQDVITLHNVYDSTNLTQNLYTDTFFEEGWNLIFPCSGLRHYSATLCPSGNSGAQVAWNCA